MTIQVGKVYRTKDNHKMGVVRIDDFYGEPTVRYYVFTDHLFNNVLESISAKDFSDEFKETSEEPEVTCLNENKVPLIFGKEYAYDNTPPKNDKAVRQKVIFLRMIETGLAEVNLKYDGKPNGSNVKVPTIYLFELSESGSISDFIDGSEKDEELTWSDVKEKMTSLTKADKMYGDLLVSIVTTRKKKGLSVEELSDMSGVSVKYIEKVERLDKTLSLKKLLKLAVALDVKIALV